MDGPFEQINDLRQQLRRLLDLAPIAGQMPACHQAIDLALHASRRARDHVCLALCRGGVPHAGKNLRQVHVLELRCTLTRKLRIQVLPCPAEWLSSLGRFPFQALRMRSLDLVEQMLVKLIPVAGDFWQQF